MAISPYRFSPDLQTSGFEDLLRPFAGWGGRMGGMLRVPEADIRETENEIYVLVDLPGMQADEIEVDLESNVLTVAGEKREEREEGSENETWHLSERRYGRFTRAFVLPREVEQEQIQARFEDGVLSVVIPKAEKARRRRIEIHDGGGAKRVEPSTGKRR